MRADVQALATTVDFPHLLLQQSPSSTVQFAVAASSTVFPPASGPLIAGRKPAASSKHASITETQIQTHSVLLNNKPVYIR